MKKILDTQAEADHRVEAENTPNKSIVLRQGIMCHSLIVMRTSEVRALFAFALDKGIVSPAELRTMADEAAGL